MKCLLRSVVALIVGSLAFSGSGFAADSRVQGWPKKPVRLIVPFAPGGSGDIIARLIAPTLSDKLGERFIVDNRPGAAGNIGVDIAARADPDGHTILIGNVSTNSINPTTYASVLKVDPAKALTGVTMIASFPLVLVSRVGFSPNTLKELVDHAIARPGELNYMLSMGSATHLDWLDFMSRAGTKMVNIPSKGAGAVPAAVISGEVDIAFTQTATAIPYINAGRMKPFVVIAQNRVPGLPNVPTMTEAGYPGIGSELWVGLFVPTGTPKAIIDKLHATLNREIQTPQLHELFVKTLVPVALSKSPEEFQKFVRTETARWAQIIKDNNFKLN